MGKLTPTRAEGILAALHELKLSYPAISESVPVFDLAKDIDRFGFSHESHPIGFRYRPVPIDGCMHGSGGTDIDLRRVTRRASLKLGYERVFSQDAFSPKDR